MIQQDQIECHNSSEPSLTWQLATKRMTVFYQLKR